MGYYWLAVIFALVIFSPSSFALEDPCMTHNIKAAAAYNNYKDALSKAILFFEGQRGGVLPSSQRVKWRANSSLSDGKPDNVDLSGGYYDAGDNVKFTWPMSFTVTLLSWAAIEYQNGITSAGEINHLREAIRWGTNFLVKAHSSSKGTITLYAQVADGNADHACWERPEDMDTPRTLYKISSSSPGSELAGEAAAALAAASIVFKTVDAKYSRTLLRHSRSLFKFADQKQASFSTSCPYYCSFNGFQDELLWAAAWLYKASGDQNYLKYVTNNQGWSKSVSEFSWDNKFAGAQTLLANEYFAGNKNLEKYKNDAESFICALMPGSGSVQFKTTPGGLLFIRDSSNLQYATSATMVLSMYSGILDRSGGGGVKCASATFTSSQIKAFAKSQVDYILGNNPKKMSYMVGFGDSYPKNLHHRGSSIPSIVSVHPEKIGCQDGYYWLNSAQPNPNVHTGAIVGGPDSSDNFLDSRSEYAHAEPTTYMNAAFVGSVAALQST
ncbi:unnamed protein product [Cuscuta epithymum]|uniref:Endoglucanase n=1 Tax=Cuscuta epithymum TaxID=186058 RepID=A0AAV0CL84_9ASTE|nr:unnamed protein product [Cuscuta epithymum]